MATRVDRSRTELPRLAAGLRPLVDRVASIRTSVHTKLLAGFLLGATLLLVVAGSSLAVQRHMADRVTEIDLAQRQLDQLRQMLYLITAQSHYRTMALLTHDDSNNTSIARAKAEFIANVDPTVIDAEELREMNIDVLALEIGHALERVPG